MPRSQSSGNNYSDKGSQRHRSRSSSRSERRGRSPSPEKSKDKRRRQNKYRKRSRSSSSSRSRRNTRSPDSYRDHRSSRSVRSSSKHSKYKRSKARRSRSTSSSNQSVSSDKSYQSVNDDEKRQPESKCNYNIGSLDLIDNQIKKDVIDEINSDCFVPRNFVSSTKKIPEKVIIDLHNETISVATVGEVKQEDDTICHANFLGEEKRRMEKWIKKLFNYRQKCFQE